MSIQNLVNIDQVVLHVILPKKITLYLTRIKSFNYMKALANKNKNYTSKPTALKYLSRPFATSHTVGYYHFQPGFIRVLSYTLRN